MNEYIFNEEYFKSTNSNVGKGISEISEKTYLSEESVKAKRNGTRTISDDDYKSIRDKVDTLLILNVAKLVEKLTLRVNLDLYPNERLVIYYVICNYETSWFSVDEFTKKIKNKKYKQKKIQEILENCKVRTDKSGKEEKLYKERYNENRQIKEFSLDLTIAIKYTELKDGK